jgi:hypothetical protein
VDGPEAERAALGVGAEPAESTRAEAEERPARTGRRRLAFGLGGLAVALAAAGGIAVWMPRYGVALPEGERRRLLQQAGLPPTFPVHPAARRMPQPAQGGISYALAEPVPDVLAWERDSLLRSGYEVFSADVEGQDEFLPRWLYFKGSDGTSGAIIIRERGTGPLQDTEVKILSRTDARLSGAGL